MDGELLIVSRDSLRDSSWWKKEALGLREGDLIVWLGPTRFFGYEDGTIRAYLTPGTWGRVVAVHDGNAPRLLDSRDTAVLPWAFVEWRNGERSSVEFGEKWKKIGLAW